jgi:alkaline phosphatase D
MPLRRASMPQGPNLKLYRTVNFGRLVAFQVLDTRQYRSPQPNDDEPSELTEDVLSPRNTILGARQAHWLKASLLQSSATWNVLAQQVLMAMVARAAADTRKYSMDKWTGYAHERMGLMQFVAERNVPNPVVLTGDIHSNWVNDLRVDDRKVESAIVATEFVGTAISSNGSVGREISGLDSLLSNNPCVRFHNRQSGYVRCSVTPKEWRSDFQVVENLSTPGGAAMSAGTFVVEAGRPGAHIA